MRRQISAGRGGIRFWVVLAAILAMIAAACSSGDGGDDGAAPDVDTEDEQPADDEDDGAGPAETGGDITIAIGSEPTTLDPQARDDGGERAVNDNIYETLLNRTHDGELVAGLATGLPEQLDATTWQFTLNSGISFHNGEPLNADAVVFSIERIRDPDLGSEQESFFATVTAAEAVDDLTVNVITGEPDPILPARMAGVKIVPPEHAQSAGFADEPVGTGPYRFVEWVKGQHVVLEANDDYWGGRPAIDQVEYRFIEEPGTRLAGLLAGEFDLITNLQPEDAGAVPQAVNITGTEHPIFILDADEGVTSDVRVRQAMNYAVDKEALANSLFLGFARVDDGQVLSPEFTGYNPNLDPYPYDPDRARELLEEAGAVGASVELVGTSGRWLKDRETVESVAQFLRDAGLDAQPRIFEFTEYLDRLFDREARGDGIYVTSSNDLLDADRQLATYYAPSGIGSSNSIEEMQTVIDEARQETDVAARQALYERATEIAYDEALFIFLMNIEDIYGLSDRLEWQPRVDGKILVSTMRLTG